MSIPANTLLTSCENVNAKCKATAPAALARFMDSSNNSLVYTVPHGPTRQDESTSRIRYNASISWDGLSVDPRPFARLDECNTVSHARKPAGCAGKRVVELEGHVYGGVFGDPAVHTGSIPMTIEQETASSFMKGSTPPPEPENSGLVMDMPYYNGGEVVVPPLCAIKAPACLSQAGPQLDGCLLTPQERRELNNFEAKMHRGVRILKKAEHQKLRLEHLIKARYPHGALNVDSQVNPDTALFTEPRAKQEARDTRDSIHAERRRERQDHIIGKPEHRFGFDPLKYVSESSDVSATSTSSATSSQNMMQRKGRGKCRPSGNDCDTHARIFRSEEASPRPMRTRALVNHLHGGKVYDIVHTAQLPEPLQPTVPERKHPWLEHPSQGSLERGRNIMGSYLAA